MAGQGTNHAVVPHAEWLAARTAFLAQEKAFTHARDELNRARRALPWERVEKRYVFDGPAGERTLADLFGSRSQLIVYHFMYAPESSGPCSHCSFTYSCYARGIDMLNGTYHFLDVVPKGRDEEGLKSPQAWVRYHDRYEG